MKITFLEDLARPYVRRQASSIRKQPNRRMPQLGSKQLAHRLSVLADNDQRRVNASWCRDGPNTLFSGLDCCSPYHCCPCSAG